MTVPIEQIARDLHEKMWESCRSYADPDCNYAILKQQINNDITEALRQACGQQPAVAEDAVQRVAEILLEACEGPKAQMNPWKPFDFAEVARKCIAAITVQAVAGYKLSAFVNDLTFNPK